MPVLEGVLPVLIIRLVPVRNAIITLLRLISNISGRQYAEPVVQMVSTSQHLSLTPANYAHLIA
jgi:hypothetical protein